jgi:hypothetical protein
MATLRIRATETDFKKHLDRMFTRLFQLFGTREEWELTVTANCVIQGNSKPTFSFWYGMDFGNKDYSMQSDEMESHVTLISSLGDIEKIPTHFSVDEFADAFFNFHTDSDVSIHSLVNIVYLARRLLTDYADDRTSVGKKLVTLW